jgi:hypothetical protein
MICKYIHPIIQLYIEDRCIEVYPHRHHQRETIQNNISVGGTLIKMS